ncbi:uncharacterized protein LOC123322304 [Coccinella septempunctata]|uniref:uncharacterized protein LOC123322304 n=1 Tax=Coccinella septempunctata TaxID=41139 RepID=UPI001D06AC5F|nr:uncharacterized protein LOC123322304 [Coccinella septempunctata]
MKDLKRSVNFFSDKITDFEAKLCRFGEAIAAVSRLEEENVALKKEVSLLNDRVNNMERHSRQNNIEVQNFSYKSGENSVDVVYKIGFSLGVQVDPHSVDYVTRVPTTIKDKHKNIVVRFTSKYKRDDFLAAYRKKRLAMGVTHAGLVMANVAEKVFLGEHLTLANKIIFKQARTLAREKGYKYVWTQSGNVLVRRNDASRIIHVLSEADLSRL